MWQKKLDLCICESEWKRIYIYINNFKALRHKKFSEFKYKVLHNILACDDKLIKWNKTHSSTCAVCKEKEDIKLTWNSVSNCLNLNILLKQSSVTTI